jgi:acyl-homoserine lactone acylase PvdQ
LRALLPLALAVVFPAAAETVDIIRDAYGTPHIFASTSAGAAFGAGYAQAEDRPEALLANLGGDAERIDLPPELKSITEAFARGVNRSLSVHGSQRTITAAQVATFARRAYSWILGSNDLILGRTRTSSASAIAVLDPLADWNAPTRPYEMSLYSNGLSIAGVTPVGMPFPVVGHSANIAIGWAPPPDGKWPLAEPRALEEAWALLTARNLTEAHRALSMNQIPGRALIATSAGDLYDSAGALPEQGYIRRASPSAYGDADAIEQLRVQHTWSFGRVEGLALSTEVYKAEDWLRRIASVAPGERFARRLAGWNRRADPDSVEALMFYLLKMELARDAAAVFPPDSVSNSRLLAALTRAQDRYETELDFNAKFGTLFRITRDGTRESFAAGGGNLPEAGMFTPRSLAFATPTIKATSTPHLAHSGQAATRIVELSPTPTASSILLPGISDDPQSTHFTDQAESLATPKRAFFNNRRELERTASSKKSLIF